MQLYSILFLVQLIILIVAPFTDINLIVDCCKDIQLINALGDDKHLTSSPGTDIY